MSSTTVTIFDAHIPLAPAGESSPVIVTFDIGFPALVARLTMRCPLIGTPPGSPPGVFNYYPSIAGGPAGSVTGSKWFSHTGFEPEIETSEPFASEVRDITVRPVPASLKIDTLAHDPFYARYVAVLLQPWSADPSLDVPDPTGHTIVTLTYLRDTGLLATN